MMMGRFYIKSIGASGNSVEYSSISFEKKVNILYGPSNSGKSYVISCINFMFGGDIPFTKESTGYDTIHVVMASENGYEVSATRKIIDGKNGDTGAPTVAVVSNYPDVESKDYNVSKNEYSDVLLKLMGINERHQVISTQELKTQLLTFRTFFHSFYIDENNIYQKNPAFDVPRHSKMTASLSGLHFLATGDDWSRFVPIESKEERELKKAKKTAVIGYINGNL